MEEQTTWLIYRHQCLVTGKQYVGLSYKTIDERWNEHVSLALDERESARKYAFQRAIQKHGVENWEHCVLQEGIPSLEEAGKAESHWIAELNTVVPNGYNQTLGGLGVPLTEEGKERHRVATKEALHRPDVRQRYLDGIRRSRKNPGFLERNRKAQKEAQNRPDVAEKKRQSMKAYAAKPGWKSPVARGVVQLTKDGEFVAEFGSLSEATRSVGCRHIWDVITGQRPFAGGFRWRYAEKNEGCNDNA